MNGLVRCRICGFVLAEHDLKDVCPACGVSRNLFDPYEDLVEPARRFFLALDFHPVVVHAPQALTFLTMVLLIGESFAPVAWLDYLVKSVVVMLALLPATAAGAFVTGLVDGTVRFRRLKAPLLREKILLGAVFFVLTLVMAGLVLAGAGGHTAHSRLLLVLNALAFVCCSRLGVVGSRLHRAVFVKAGGARRPAPEARAVAPRSRDA